jgi:hypothetical protein
LFNTFRAVYQGNIFECHPRESGSQINGLFGQTALLAPAFAGMTNYLIKTPPPSSE